MGILYNCLVVFLATVSTQGVFAATVTDNAGTLAARATQACNNYIEFCDRKYSNITEVCAHNSPFHVPGNLASNQDYDVFTQLNDGIRMLEGQTHMLNGTLHYCHSYCALLDAGPVEDYYRNVSQWLDNNPNEVVSLIIANGDRSSVSDFVAPIQASGLARYVYTPPKVPMGISDWPTLGDMIKSNTRVVLYMDYGANQAEVPYILDQYTHMWQTPISPTNRNFPCTREEPPRISDAEAKNWVYLVNHNLNSILDVGNSQVLIPDQANINTTNGVSGYGSLGQTVETCKSEWSRAPNFLVVDYYNNGFPSKGSVFEVAATANGVTYNGDCCGLNATVTSTASPSSTASGSTTIATNSSSRAPQYAVDMILQCIGLLVVMLKLHG